MTYARGRLSPSHLRKAFRFNEAMGALIDPLGLPPSSSNNYLGAVQRIICPMYGNDQYGDCVEADTAHTMVIRTANTSSLVIPTKWQVLDLYQAVTGFIAADPSTDNGTEEPSMCQHLKEIGFLGHKLDDWATIDPTNFDRIKWCIQLFGFCRIGLNLPGYAEQQFTDGLPWDVSQSGDQTQAGHDVPLVHYDGDLFYACTWGKWKQPATRAFLTKYCDEAHPELYYDWINKQGVAPSKLSLSTLEQRMKEAAA
jgi:hypothetical protein